jgi:hypothetical protein
VRREPTPIWPHEGAAPQNLLEPLIVNLTARPAKPLPQALVTAPVLHLEFITRQPVDSFLPFVVGD